MGVSRPNNVTIPPGRLRLLLAALALSPNQPVAVDTLAEQLWPEQQPRQVRDSLHVYVVRLRKLLGPDAIQTQPGGGYQLIIDPDAVDVHRFRTLLKQARQVNSPERELPLLRAALDLWRDRPFADLYSTWLDSEVAPQLTDEWLAATGRRVELELASEPPASLIAELRDLTGRHPHNECLWALLITALNRAGRRADALDAFLVIAFHVAASGSREQTPAAAPQRRRRRQPHRRPRRHSDPGHHHPGTTDTTNAAASRSLIIHALTPNRANRRRPPPASPAG